jgi:hypothetical protein
MKDLPHQGLALSLALRRPKKGNTRDEKFVTFSPAPASNPKPMDVAATPAPEPCGEKARLLAEYQERVRLYNVAVSALSEARPRANRKDYLRMQQYADQARQKAERAGLALEQHTNEHGGCGTDCVAGVTTSGC